MRTRRNPMLKGGINGPAAILVRSMEGSTMLQITKSVKKSVEHPTSGKNVTRECKVSFPAVDPKSEDWLDDAVSICNGDLSLVAKLFNFGLYRFIQQAETNNLGKVGEVSKSYAKTLAGFTGMGLSIEEARALIMSNPVTAAKLQNETFEQFTESKIEDFKAYQSGVDDKGATYDRIQDITAVADEPEADKAE